MMWLKGCPTCGGDLYTTSDMYGTYVNCLQCGRTLTEREEVMLKMATRRPRVSQMTAPRVRELAAVGRG